MFAQLNDALSMPRIALLLLLFASFPAATTSREKNYQVSRTGGTPVFYRDVLPILQNHCQVCHRPGEMAPIPLLTYAQARANARILVDSIVARKMPPWFADPTVGQFSNANFLTPQEIKTFSDWVAAGTPAGDSAAAPTAPNWGARLEYSAAGPGGANAQARKNSRDRRCSLHV
jgi:hypothetical protein